MKLLFVAGAAAALIASAASAVTVVGTFGAPDPGKAANQRYVVTFDAPSAVGYSWTGGIQVTNQTNGNAAAPAGTAPGGFYGYVSSALDPNTATLLTPNLSSISFYWGSIDEYNKLEILGADGFVLRTLTGSMLPPSNGNQSAANTNRRIFINADAGESITGLRFASTGVAFEFDSFAAAGAVPEPQTWALLIVGFGLVGVASRRRRNSAVTD